MSNPQPLISRLSGPLKGTVAPPGDKSISHRAVMLGGIAEGETLIRGLLEGEDVLGTIGALRALGVDIEKDKAGTWHIKGVGLNGSHAAATSLDMGNSGTAARLLIGLLSGRPFTSAFTGDASLQKRPMQRIIEPLMQMGATFESKDGRLPLRVTGAARPVPISYRLPMPSAQVKSAILLAGLSASGTTTVIEPQPTRDHTERMLRHFGAAVKIAPGTDGEEIALTGRPQLKGQSIAVPADISSAAFPLVAALLHVGSQVTLKNVGLNPRRAGLIATLQEMGANITLTSQHEQSGEPVADLVVAGSALKGITVPTARAPSMIDEYPILAIAAACAEGVTRMQGLGELRVKESDRLALMSAGLNLCGVAAEVEGDDLIVHGAGPPAAKTIKGGVMVVTAMDHRIAMSFLVLGSVTREAVRIDDGSFIATSFPDFVATMNGLGMKMAGR